MNKTTMPCTIVLKYRNATEIFYKSGDADIAETITSQTLFV